jgi:transcriptional regulator with XRE-family HTH domain
MDETSDERRGARFREIRKALDLTQEAFAERLTKAAKELGVGAGYSIQDVSGRETGRKRLEIDDYVLASYVDPARRSFFWLAYGRELPKAMLIQRPSKIGKASSAD